MGPCTNMSTTRPWLASGDGGVGPSGPDVFAGPTGTLEIAYHAWYGSAGRAMWIARVTFSP
jgi:hypothetical protein